MASSAPATSLNDVFGVSLVMSFALDLPKFMTREPPPCIWFRKTKNSRKMARNGSQPSSSDQNELVLGITAL